MEKKYPFSKILIYRLEFIAIKLITFFLNLLSLENASKIGAWGGSLAYYLLKRKRQTALENLALAFPEKTLSERKRIARKSFECAGMSMVELFMIQKIVDTAHERFDVSETKNYDRAISQGKGVLLACSHLGAWECHELLSNLKNTPLMVIVKNLKNPFVNDEINRLRSLTSVEPVSKDHAIRAVYRAIKKKEIVAILLDQWAGPDGIWAPFFGKETSTTTIAARFAQKTKGIIVPSFCIRVRPGRFKLICLPEVTVDNLSRNVEMEITQKLNLLLEEKIRQYPEQWIWGHRRWKDRPEKTRSF